MTWIIITLVVALILGPIMYLVPTPKDKRLSALRLAARKAGLVVKISSLPKLDPQAFERVTAGGKALEPKIACTAYELPMPQGLSGFGEFSLLRLPPEPTVSINEVLPGWSLQPNSTAWVAYMASQESVATLTKSLASLPPDSVGFSVNARYVACYWQERATVEDTRIAEIQSALSVIADDLVARYG